MATVPFGSQRLPVVPAYIAYGDPITDPASALGSVTFDVVVAEEHERTAIVTDHAVEEGVNIVDHVRPLPDRVQLDVYVSNAPINSPDALRLPLTIDLPQPGQGGFLAGGTSALLQQGLVALGLMGGLPTTLTAYVDQFLGDTDYVRQTYDLLTSLRDQATIMQVITPRATYTSMILENIKMHRDVSTGTGANMTLEFRQVRIITSSVVDAPLPSIPRASVNVSKGKKDPSQTDGPKQSVLALLAGKLGLNIGAPAAGFPAP